MSLYGCSPRRLVSKSSSSSMDSSPIYLATASMDGLVRVYMSHPELGIELKCSFEGPGEGIECTWIDWHPRGLVLIGGFADGSVWMWNAQLGKVMTVFGGHVTSPTNTGCFTPDGKGIVVGSEEGILLVLNPLEPEVPFTKIVPQVHQETSLQDVTHVSVHPITGQIFMAADSTGHLRVYKCSSGVSSAFQGMPLNDLSVHHSASIEGLGFHPLGNLSASAGMDGKLVIYDSTFAPRHVINIKNLFANEDEDEEDNESESDGFTVMKWLGSMANGSSLPSSLSFGLLVGTARGRLMILEGRSGLPLRRLRGRGGRPVLDASVSSNGILAVAFDDGIVSLYQL